MTYRVEFVRSAAKTYSRLDPVLQRRVDRELSRLRKTPRHPGVIRLQSTDEFYRVRIGDLRLLFSVGAAANSIHPTAAGTCRLARGGRTNG